MARLEDRITLRSRLIRHFNKMPEAEFNEIEDAVFCVMADAVDEFERQRGRTVGDWAIQIFDWLPGRRQMLLCKGCERPIPEELDKRWQRMRPQYRAQFESTVARLRTRVEAVLRGEPVPNPMSRAKRTKALAEFMVLAWGPQ